MIFLRKNIILCMTLCAILSAYSTGTIMNKTTAYAEQMTLTGEQPSYAENIGDPAATTASVSGTYKSGRYGLLYSLNNDEFITINGYNADLYYPTIDMVLPDVIYIPKEIDNYPVGRIGSGAFASTELVQNKASSCTVEDLIIDSSEYDSFTIGVGAFQGCKRLRRVKLPENLTVIEKEAFFECDRLKEITIPKSVTSIEDHALGFIWGEVIIKDETGDFISYPSIMPMADFTIYGYKGTEAERYAKDNGFVFESIDPSGDVNGDGELTMKDNLLLQKYILGQTKLSKGQMARADIFNDGSINCFDLSELKRSIIEKRSSMNYSISIDQHFSNINERFDSNAIIRSKNEMIDFLEDYISRKDIAEIYSSKYTNEFFEDNVLLMGSFLQNCGGRPAYNIDSVISPSSSAGDSLLVCYTSNYPALAVDVISRVIAQIVIPKEQFTFDNVYWTEVNICLN